MNALPVSNDASPFEVSTVLDETGRLTDACARKALAIIRAHGLVVFTNLLSEAEADMGAALVRQTIDDPDRNKCAFASQTDNRYKRRDFCSLPSTSAVTEFSATLCQRLERVVAAYCDRSHPLLEVTTLTSYLGSSHQYIHRDPSGVISLFATVEDVSEQQGGTVFVPGTHMDGDAEKKRGGDAYALMELFRVKANYRVLAYNLKKLWNMRKSDAAPLASGEFRDRVFSSKWDEHQPNLLRFAMGKNSLFSLRMLSPNILWKLYRHRNALSSGFHLVQTAPRKGSVILYLSDMLHAGPDNRSPDPRRLFSMSIAREAIEPKRWHAGYSPHPSLIASPLNFGDLLEMPLPAPSDAQAQFRTATG